MSEAKNFAQYVQHTANQVTQITNQVTQIENQVIQLERLGDPRTYIGLLQIDKIFAAADQIQSGVGQTISGYRNVVNGALALQYTAGGLYQNYSNFKDRYGNLINWDTGAFRKFQTFNDMSEAYNTSERDFNTSMGTLMAELKLAHTKLNAATGQIDREAYAAEINGIAAQMNAAAHNANLSGQRAQILQAANQNDAARTQEAQRQITAQENQYSAQRLSQTVGGWIGGQ